MSHKRERFIGERCGAARTRGGGLVRIAVEPEVAAKLAVIEAVRTAGIKSDFARRIGKDEKEARGILDLRHPTKAAHSGCGSSQARATTRHRGRASRHPAISRITSVMLDAARLRSQRTSRASCHVSHLSRASF